MHRVISHYNKLRMVEDISMDGKDKLEKFSKKNSKGRKHDVAKLVLD